MEVDSDGFYYVGSDRNFNPKKDKKKKVTETGGGRERERNINEGKERSVEGI